MNSEGEEHILFKNFNLSIHTCTVWVGGEEFAEEWDPLSLSLEGYLGMRGEGGVKP